MAPPPNHRLSYFGSGSFRSLMGSSMSSSWNSLFDFSREGGAANNRQPKFRKSIIIIMHCLPLELSGLFPFGVISPPALNCRRRSIPAKIARLLTLSAVDPPAPISADDPFLLQLSGFFGVSSPLTTFQHYIYFDAPLERFPGATLPPPPILHLMCHDIHL